MTGFTSKRQATADKLDDDAAQGYIRPWVGLTDEELAYAYTLEKKFAMQYVDAKLKEKNYG
jgi:hypothetical protein